MLTQRRTPFSSNDSRMHIARFLSMVLLLAAGCGPPDRAEIRYRNMTFLSPYATGEYKQLEIIDSVAHETGRGGELSRPQIPQIYFRIDGKNVLHLPTLTPQQAAASLTETPRSDPKSTFRTFSHPHALTIVFYEHSDSLYTIVGNVNGKYGPGVEIGSKPGGPFHRIPLTRDQIVEMFGPPAEGFAGDYPHVN